MARPHSSEKPPSKSTFQPNRRDVMKASAGVGVAVAVGGGISNLPQPQVATAQEADGTVGRSWDESVIDTSIKLQGDGWVTLETEFPYWALGFGWDAEVGTWPKVEFAVSFDGKLWDEGYAMTSRDDGGPAPADNRVHTDLFFGDGQQFVRYRTLDGEGNLVILDRFQVTYINPTDGPWEPDRPMTMMRTSAVNTDTAKPPTIITRAQWGANERYRNDAQGEIWPPEYAEVEHAIVHHAAVNYGSDGYNAVRSIYYYHCVTQGWGDIGYNYVVDVRGNIFEGRVGGANVIGGHAYQYAVGSSGICVMGDYTYNDAPQAAKSALAHIIAYVTRDLNPHGSKQFHEVPNLPTIAAHRDVVQSGCPGDGLYDDMPWIRNTVADILNRGALDSQMPGGLVPGDWVKVQTDDGSSLPMRAQPGLSQLVSKQIPNGTRVEIERGPISDSDHNWYLVLYSGSEGWVPADHLLLDPPDEDPMDGYMFGQNVRLGSNVVLRSSPSTSATSNGTESNTWAFLLAGPYPAGGTRWFQVQTQHKRHGWVTINQFTLDKYTSPTSAYAIGSTVRTLSSGSILVRAGIGQTVQANVSAGTTLTISVAPVGTTGKTWYGVYGGTGIGGGWIDADNIDVAPQAISAVGQRFRVTETMNYRTGPGTWFPTKGLLVAGTTGSIIGGPTQASGYRWWDVRTDSGQQGWAAANWLVTAGGTSTPSQPSDPPPSGGKFSVGDTARVTEALNMRSGASTGNGVIAVLPAGTTGRVSAGPQSGSGYTWWRIETSYGTGWVVENWIARTGGTSTPSDPAPSPGGKFDHGSGARVTEALNMRSGASTGNGVVAVLPAGTTGTIVDGPRSGSGYTWWRIQTSYGTGWVVENWITPTGGTSTPSDPPPSSGAKFKNGDGARVTEGLNMRTSASTSGGVITVLPAGTTGTIVDGPRSANGYTWWRIQTSYGTGWVVENWISPTGGTSTPAQPRFANGDTATVTEALNLRSGPGTGSGVITILPAGSTGKVIDGPRSASGYTWWRLETSRGTGWAAQDWLRK